MLLWHLWVCPVLGEPHLIVFSFDFQEFKGLPTFTESVSVLRMSKHTRIHAPKLLTHEIPWPSMTPDPLQWLAAFRQLWCLFWLKCLSIVGFKFSNEQFKKLIVNTALRNLRCSVLTQISPYCCSSVYFNVLWVLSIIAWPVEEYGMPFWCSTPHYYRKSSKALEVYAGPLSSLNDLWDFQHREGLQQMFLCIYGLLSCMGRGINSSRESINWHIHIWLSLTEAYM